MKNDLKVPIYWFLSHTGNEIWITNSPTYYQDQEKFFVVSLNELFVVV